MPLDTTREQLAREVHRRWQQYEAGIRSAHPLARRDADAREILDDDREAFERLRRPGEAISLAEVQQDIVDAIRAMEERSLGHHAIVRLILETGRRRARRRAGHDRPVRLLEAAAGSGWLQRHLWRRARQARIPVELTASDLNPELVASLRARLAADGVPCGARVADARAIPDAADGAYDVAFMTYTLHHLSPPDAALCLRELDRVAGGGLVLVDIARRALNVPLIRLAMATLGRRGGRFAVHDGMASVRRGYTAAELRLLLDWVGLGGRYVVGPLPTLHPQRLVAHAIWPA